jgi:integrase
MPTPPDKPRADFPLFAHRNGQWAKKIRGTIRYFGVWSDPEAALQKYRDEVDDLQAGRTPARGVGLTVVALVNEFLTFKKRRLDAGELTQRTWEEYDDTCNRVMRVLGRQRPVGGLRPSDFDELRADIAKTRKAVALSTEVQRCRSLFKFAMTSHLVDSPVKMGENFTKAPAAAIRKAKNAQEKRVFDAAQIHSFLSRANVHLKAMILLGINCGFGQSDIAALPLTAFSPKSPWLRFPRPKTGIHRASPLWPETMAAMAESLAARNRPWAEYADRFFVSKQGRPVVWYKPNKGGLMDGVAKAFVKVQTAAGDNRRGVGFYALRHTFRTIADECRDPAAIKLIMGHSDDDPTDEMRAIYVEAIDDARLIAVSDHVRAWLYGEKK